MRQSIIITAMSLTVAIAACKSSTEPPQNSGKLGTAITVSLSDSASLDGGGRFFSGADTGVWYDVNLSVGLQNSSSSAHTIDYKLEFGFYANETFIPNTGDLFFDTDSIVTVANAAQLSGGAGITLSIEPTIGIGRRNNDWSKPYGYRLTLYDRTSGDSLRESGVFSGSNPNNRFHGIIYTTEQSPDPLGVFDGPDDADWTISDSNYSFGPCFPNPSSGNTTIRFSLPDKGDSIMISINKTKRSIVKTLLDVGGFSAGTYDYTYDDSTLTSGDYRIYGRIAHGNSIYKSHGDIIWNHF